MYTKSTFFFWRGGGEQKNLLGLDTNVHKTWLTNYCFVFFFVFQEKIKFPIFLSQWPFSLFVAKTCLSDRIFPEFFFACGGLINLRVTFGNSFFTQKTASKTLLSSIFQTAFWAKKEFPNVIHKLISPPQAKKMFCKNTVAETSFRDEERKRSLRQENWLFIYKKKNGNIIVSVTVNSVAPLQKNMSQWQTFGEMKLKIKKTKKKKNNTDKQIFQILTSSSNTEILYM